MISVEEQGIDGIKYRAGSAQCPRIEEARKEKEMAEALSNAEVPAMFQEEFISGWSPKEFRIGQEWLDSGLWLYLYDDEKEMHESLGTGKSHMAGHLLIESIKKGKSGLFTTAQRISSWRFDKWQAESDRLFKVDVLVIDDLSALRETDYSLDKAGMVIDERYSSLKQTIITANIPLKEFRINEKLLWRRMASRIKGRTGERFQIKMAGKDRR
jgi:hypothetical protein